MASWTCKNCTFVNDTWFRRCAVCNLEKGASPKKDNTSDEATINWDRHYQEFMETEAEFGAKPSQSKQDYNKATKPKTLHTKRDEYLMAGLIKECNIDYIVSSDIINLLLLFCTIGDCFDLDVTHEQVIVTPYQDVNAADNKYGLVYEQVKAGPNELNAFTAANRYHAIATKQVSRGVKYKWHITCKSDARFNPLGKIMFVGIIDNRYVSQLYKQETVGFFSDKYHGYALCLNTGDVYHNNEKYGKPYILQLDDMPRPQDGTDIITVELDLTGKFYGSLCFRIEHNVKNGQTKKMETQYWDDIELAYDDILVNRQYRLAVAMEHKCSIMLFDDYH